MMLREPAKGGKCKTCGVILPVPSWTKCMLHDRGTKSRVIKRPYIELKKVIVKPFHEYLSYSIHIPFNDFIKAKELVYDPDTYAIIGWR